MGGGVDDIDNAPRPHAGHAAEADEPRHRDWVGQAAGLDDDGVEVKPWIGELGQRLVESAVVRQAAHAATGDRAGLVDLAGDQSGIHVERTKVVDDHADSCSRGPQDMV